MARHIQIAATSNRRRGAAAAAANPLLTGLVAYYKFSSNGDDSTGNWDLTEVDTPTYSDTSEAVSGKTGSYTIIESDNSEYFFNTSFDSLHGATKATWMFFIKPDSFVESGGIASEWDQSNNSNWLVDTGGAGNDISVFGGNEAAGNYAFRTTIDAVLTVGTWTHVRITLDTTQSAIADQCHIYIWNWNGSSWVEDTYGGLTGNGNTFVTLPTYTARTFAVGAGQYYASAGNWMMDGQLDEFGIWDLVVSDADAELHRLATGLPYPL